MSGEQPKFDMDASMKRVEEKLALSKKLVDQLMDQEDCGLDGDGYPTEAALDVIREWTFQMSDRELFDFIKSIWWMPDWSWKECEAIDERTGRKSYCYYISTGGWSGNESIIQAMQENKWMFWHMHWVQSRRGGHYIFELRKEDDRET